MSRSDRSGWIYLRMSGDQFGEQQVDGGDGRFSDYASAKLMIVWLPITVMWRMQYNPEYHSRFLVPIIKTMDETGFCPCFTVLGFELHFLGHLDLRHNH